MDRELDLHSSNADVTCTDRANTTCKLAAHRVGYREHLVKGIDMQWKTVIGFGMTHLLLPNLIMTVCEYRPNPNSDVRLTSNINKTVTCPECRKFAQVMQIPTA
jgi:hypothetical protein